jgi:hypothetical protein
VGWTKRRGKGCYYCRYDWVDGRSVTHYVGRGPAGAAAAALDRLARLEREAARRAWAAEAARAEEVSRLTAGYQEACVAAARAALVAAGYRRAGGDRWRGRRGR